MSDFKKLHVWQKAHALALYANRVAMKIRGAHYVSVRSQVIRAALSIPANIAEGRERNGERDFARFLRYALNSTSDLEYHLIAGRDIRVIPESDFVSLLSQLVEVRMMLHGLLRRVMRSEPAGTTRENASVRNS